MHNYYYDHSRQETKGEIGAEGVSGEPIMIIDHVKSVCLSSPHLQGPLLQVWAT